MEEMKCPNCKGTKFETLGSGKYRCNYCGTEFTTSQPQQDQQQSSGSVINNYVNIEQKSALRGCLKAILIAFAIFIAIDILIAILYAVAL